MITAHACTTRNWGGGMLLTRWLSNILLYHPIAMWETGRLFQ